MGIKVLVTSIPHFAQYPIASGVKPIWSPKPHKVTQELCVQLNTPYLDSYAGLYDLISGSKQQEYYYRADMHFNPQGYAAWAKLHLEALLLSANALLPHKLVSD